MNFVKVAFLLGVCAFVSEMARAEEAGLTQQKLHQIFNHSGFSGTVLITQNAKPLFHKGYDLADKEWQIPNAKNTKFRIASLSKTFTEVIIMKLMEEGHLDIDEPLKRYLPNYPAAYSHKVTLRHLLTHRSGIPRLFNIPNWASGESLVAHSKTAFLSMIAEMPVEYNVDEKRLYSSANYYLLGAVIESVTGESFAKVVNDKILTPLNLNNTGVYSPGQLVEGLARPYKSVSGKYAFCPDVDGEFCLGGNINLALFKASGSMHSTVADLARWAQEIGGDDFLSPSSKTLLYSPSAQASWDVQQVQLANNQSLELLVADGNLEGFSSMLIKLPQQQISIVMLNNTGMDYQNKVELGLKILDVLLE